MPGPPWEDDPADADRIVANCDNVLKQLRKNAPFRRTPDLDEACRWHEDIYAGCNVPNREYVGHFRGDTSYPDLVGYQVGIGALQPDGLPENVGVAAASVADELQRFIVGFRAAVAQVDALIPDGHLATTEREIEAVAVLAAFTHGEWVRIHPFVNGNGRIARVWVAWIVLQYGLPVFLTLKPRPNDPIYARAGRDSMGRPPDFQGDHTTAIKVFVHLLSQAVGP